MTQHAEPRCSPRNGRPQIKENAAGCPGFPAKLMASVAGESRSFSRRNSWRRGIGERLVAAVALIHLCAVGQNSNATTIADASLVIEASQTTGDYSIRTKSGVVDSLTGHVAAEVNHAWLQSADYPEHVIAETSIQDEFGEGAQLSITNTGLGGKPDLISILRVHSSPSFAELECVVRNNTANEISVQDIRILEAEGSVAVNLNGPDDSDRVLSDSFSEDRPTMAIRDLFDAKNGVHRAVGSQLLYNRESQQSLFLGALTSAGWLTVLRLHLDPGKTQITRYEVDSEGTTELAKDNSLRKSPPDDQIELSLPVAPGESLSSERLMVSLGSDYHAQLETYGAVIRLLHRARVDAPTPIGWWSWTAYFFGLNQGTALTNAQWLSAHLKDLGYSYFHIDEGYQYARGEYTTPDAALFPGGMAKLEEKVRGAGLTPGIWTAPFEISERSWVYEHHKDWLVHNAAGEPIHAGFIQGGNTERLFVLDTTNPAAQGYLRQTYTTLVKDWGIRYVKLDFMEDSAVEGYYYRPNTTAMEAQRIGLEIIRDAVGDDVLLDKDGSPMLNPVGIVDAGRVSADTSHDYEDIRDAATGIAARYYMNRNFFINDPDAFTVSKQVFSDKDRPLSLDEGKSSIALAAVSGGMFEIGDDLPTLADEKERLAPVQNRELINIARWGRASIPLDLMTYPPEQGRPSVFVLEEGPARAIVTLFNWSDKPYTRTYKLASGEKVDALYYRAFGLPAGTYRITDVLDGSRRLEGTDRQLTLTQPPHSVRMLRFEKLGAPAMSARAEIVGPPAAEAGQSVTFSAQVGNDGMPAVAYRWEFGDGTTAEGPTISHTYTHTCDCAVILATEGIDGSTAKSEHEIQLKGSIDTRFLPSRNRRPPNQNQQSNESGGTQQ